MKDDDDGLIPKERALNVIGPERLDTLRDVQLAAWQAWEAIRATREGSGLSRSARARIVYDETVMMVRDTFPSSMCTSQHGLLVLDFDELLCRFKKLDDTYTPRGIPTGQATLFEEQAHLTSPQRAFWPRRPMVHMGYIVHELGASIERQVLVLRRRGTVMWVHDVAAADGGMPGPILIPLAPPPTPRTSDVQSAREARETRKEEAE